MRTYIQKHKYILLILYLPVYLIAFFTIDKIPADHFVIRCPLDRLIPFNEYMVIPYALWFFWFPGWVFFFLWHALKADGALDLFSGNAPEPAKVNPARDDFIKLCAVMFTSMTLSLIIYVCWPNAVDLREPITATNLCARAVELIRASDTPYGVCPSIHIATIIAEMLVIRDSRLSVLSPTVRWYTYIITALITWSTMAIKQHSIVDVVAGALLAYVLYKVWVRFVHPQS